MHSLDFMVFSSLDIYVLTVTVGRAVILIRGVGCLMFKILSFSKKKKEIQTIYILLLKSEYVLSVIFLWWPLKIVCANWKNEISNMLDLGLSLFSMSWMSIVYTFVYIYIEKFQKWKKKIFIIVRTSLVIVLTVKCNALYSVQYVKKNLTDFQKNWETSSYRNNWRWSQFVDFFWKIYKCNILIWMVHFWVNS